MAVAGGAVQEFDFLNIQAERGRLSQWTHALTSFARKKPLGAFCGLVVIFSILIGDFVPASLNKIASTAGLGEPVPYLADVLRDNTGFVYPYNEKNLRDRRAGISTSHLLGTDGTGQDVFSRLLYGARVAVIVSVAAVMISETIGATIGIVAGYYGGFVDKFLYRIVDVFQALPGLIVLIAILGLLGSGLWEMVFAIGIIGGPPASRIIRGQTISIMTTPYIEAGKSIGASDLRIMWKYVLPNVFALIILGSTLRLGQVVLIEASLSFLGFGVPGFPTWGQMLSTDGRTEMRVQPGLAIYPGLCIGILVFSYNLFGDALRDVLDPRLRGTR
jgi:peptide/nickel transport system permease protein